MTSRSYPFKASDYTEFLAQAAQEQGLTIVIQSGVVFARIELDAESGESLVTDVNLSAIAADFERRLS